MQIMGNLFNIVLFVTLTGSVFTILSLLANRVFRFALPLWFGVCGIVLWILPLSAPGLELISPEEQFWLRGYCIVCFVWAGGAAFFTLFFLVRSVLAGRAVRRFPVCTDRRINESLGRCVRVAGCRKTPPVYYGTLSNHPACVAGVFRPVIIVKKEVVNRLTDTELMAVLCHEITHIRRGHILLGNVYDYVCAVNWFNPFVWIAKGDFAMHCEVDCDRHALRYPDTGVTEAGYASAMLRLLELSVVPGKTGSGMGALGFPIIRKRIELILEKPAKIRIAVVFMAAVVIMTAVLRFAVSSSRVFFYPYPAGQAGTEYADGWP